MRSKLCMFLLLLTGCATSNLDANFQNALKRQPVIQGSKFPSLATLKKVKAEQEHFVSKSDQETYGVLDYWATPNEFTSLKKGDCEDFVLYAYYRLREEGFSKEDLDILIVIKNRWPQPREQHAILMVTLDGEKYVVDDNIPVISTYRDEKRIYDIIYKMKQ